MSSIRHEPVAANRVTLLLAGSGIDPHRHDQHQILYAGRGALQVSTDVGLWVAPANRALWIPADAWHAHHAYGDLELNTVGVPLAHNPLALTSPAALTVSPLLRELILACARGVGDAPARRRMLRVLLDQVRAAPLQPMHLPLPGDPRLRSVCGRLDADPGTTASLAELGRGAGASERTLSRLFRAELGMTFPHWRRQLRLVHAVNRLAVGASVTSVAHGCGWASSSAFIHDYRAAFGHTPGRRISSAPAPTVAAHRAVAPGAGA